jgi:outer membrane lipoprotein-sorting protein
MSFSRSLAFVGAAALAATSLTPAMAQSSLSAGDRAAVDQAADYLQALDQVEGRFVQTDWRGTQSQGEFYLQRPGRARFVYDPPSSLLVVADGRNVSVSDPRLKTFNRYPLGSTPLSLFLTKDVRFDRGVAVTRVDQTADGFSLTAHDAAHPNQGEVVLTFAIDPMRLREWRLTDREGHVTDLRITQFQAVTGLDPSLFVLDDPRAP